MLKGAFKAWTEQNKDDFSLRKCTKSVLGLHEP